MIIEQFILLANTPLSIDQNQTIALPLIKKPSQQQLRHLETHAVYQSSISSSDTLRSISSSSSSSSSTSLKENVELILKAIQHIEGEHILRSGDPSDDVFKFKHLTEKLNLKSASVLKHLLSDDQRKNNKPKPTVHSVDSLI